MDSSKRITVKLKCPNPLFEEWLTIWRDQAAAKDSRMKYSFNQALKSLQKYPLPLDSGRECKILKGFGDRLCKMLDDKLREFKKNNGNRNQNSGSILPQINNLNEVSRNTNVENRKPVERSKILPRNKQKPDSTKQYIPQYGSGGYAILVTLYEQSLQPDYAGFLRKAEIIQHGKDLINSSFTKPEPGSRYTAWSSMRTLLTKNLVSKASHPPKFSLTEEGLILARKLYENSNGAVEETDTLTLINTHETADFIQQKDTLEFEGNSNDIFKSYDIVDIPDEFLENPWNPDNDTFSDNLENRVKFMDRKSRSMNSISKFDSYINEDIESSNSNNKVTSMEVNIRKNSKMQNKNLIQRYASSSSVSSQKHSVENEFVLQQKPKKTLQKYASANVISAASSTNNILQSSSEPSLKKYTSSSSIASTKSTVSVIEDFIMAPYSFDIILYVDTQETSGSSSNEEDEVLVGLKKFGVKYEVKNLKVGDFTWICRDRLSNKELILPYIIERKRMDDFAHSIRDKRYHEQKFRLKKSGIENITYLVESHGRNDHLGMPLQTLCQAATNTAIQENFFIKYTENIRETVEYLANFSRSLIGMFKSKTLASCSKENMQSVDINSDLIALMTFKEFNESSVKNKRMKVTDLFVKMLIQIKGMSVERALAVTQIYPTPMLLKIAYEENPSSIGEKLLSNIKFGTYGKSIGVVLSKTVYQAFNKMQY